MHSECDGKAPNFFFHRKLNEFNEQDSICKNNNYYIKTITCIIQSYLQNCRARARVCRHARIHSTGQSVVLPPATDIRGPFEKFMDSPYYLESELCGGAVTVPFSKYLLWQAMHFLQRSTHFSKTCCRPLINSKFLASELPFSWSEKPRNRMRRGLDRMDFFQAEHKIQFISCSMRFQGFSNH
jgi:hypothetical protein